MYLEHLSLSRHKICKIKLIILGCMVMEQYASTFYQKTKKSLQKNMYGIISFVFIDNDYINKDWNNIHLVSSNHIWKVEEIPFVLLFSKIFSI